MTFFVINFILMLSPPPTPSKGGKKPVFSPPLEGAGGGVRKEVSTKLSENLTT